MRISLLFCRVKYNKEQNDTIAVAALVYFKPKTLWHLVTKNLWVYNIWIPLKLFMPTTMSLLLVRNCRSHLLVVKEVTCEMRYLKFTSQQLDCFKTDCYICPFTNNCSRQSREHWTTGNIQLTLFNATSLKLGTNIFGWLYINRSQKLKYFQIDMGNILCFN